MDYDSARESLARSLKELVDEADNLLAKAERTGSEKYTAARDKFESQLRDAKHELSRFETRAIDTAKRAVRVTDEAVHDHPYTAIGIGAGVGLLIGMLITARR